MAFDIGTKANIAFKRALGKIHSSNDRDPGNEPNATKILMGAQDVWARSVHPDPLDSSNDVVIARGDAADPYGKGDSDRLILELDPISGTDNYGPYSGFYVRIPAGGVPVNLQGKTNPFTGSAYQAGDRVGNIIPVFFGFDLRPKLYDDTSEVPSSHESDWYLDPYAGILTQEDDEPSKMVNFGTTGKLHCYVYIGDYVSDRLSSLGGGTTYTFYENQTIGSGITGTIDGSNVDFELDNIPIAASLQVYLNGMLQKQGEDYTITDNVTTGENKTITFTEAPEVVTIGTTDYPDQIVASYRVEDTT